MKQSVAWLLVLLVVPLSSVWGKPASHFANADDPALVREGRVVYMMSCSSCHGRRLEGQALWQVMDKYAGRRAPPQDATGHTWQHSDEALFQKTRTGYFPTEPRSRHSYMPAFNRMSDHDILAALAYIKSSWPVGIRASQAMLNPGQKGMPKNAEASSWTLPPNCSTGSAFLFWSAARK